MNIDKTMLTQKKGFLEGAIDAVDQTTSLVSGNYKKNVCRNFIAISFDMIDSRIAGEEFYITRKYDGEMNVIFLNGTDSFIINSSGKVRTGIPCINEAANALIKAGIQSAIIPAELYVCEKNGRTRVFDVLSALSKEEEISKLQLAPFDIIEIDNLPLKVKGFEDTYKKLVEIFGTFETVKPVNFTKVTSKAEVKDIYKKWVEEDGSEGLVVRSDLPLIFKIKPKHNLDTVVVGYSEGIGEFSGQIRTLLLALMTDENTYQIIGRTGNGFSDDLKKEFFNNLSKKIIQSEYIDTDSNHVAFHMVEPQTVIEISYNDVLFEGTISPILNPILTVSDKKYRLISTCKGISLIYPIFIRVRDDKKANEVDVRFSQITDLFYLSGLCDQSSLVELPKSELIFREVYKKEAKDKIMVQKFLIWKTNKENSNERFPAFVFYYTNFSSDRKEPLQRDSRISSSKDQIFEIMKTFQTENIKKGWIKI